MAEDDVSDPKENPIANGHLPVSGEVGGPVSYHDPTTADTDDDPGNDPIPGNIDEYSDAE